MVTGVGGIENLLKHQADHFQRTLDNASDQLTAHIRVAAREPASDLGDRTTEQAELQHEQVLAGALRQRLIDTRTALQRISDGTYGKCQDCGQTIAADRLLAVPRAARCLSCQVGHERTRDSSR